MLTKVEKMELLIELMKTGEVFEVYNSRIKVGLKVKFENGEFLALNNVKEQYTTASINLNTLLDDVNTIKSKFIPKVGGLFYFITSEMEVDFLNYWINPVLTNIYKVNNCFRTQQEAEQMRDKILILLQNREC